MSISQCEAGRELFMSYARDRKELFKETRSRLEDRWKDGRQVEPKVYANLPYDKWKAEQQAAEAAADNALVKQMMTIFLDTFCKTADERRDVDYFFTQKIAKKLAKKHDRDYLNITSQSSAFMRILWRSARPMKAEEVSSNRKFCPNFLKGLRAYIASFC